jgi:hypothetical protein
MYMTREDFFSMLRKTNIAGATPLDTANRDGHEDISTYFLSLLGTPKSAMLLGASVGAGAGVGALSFVPSTMEGACDVV